MADIDSALRDIEAIASRGEREHSLSQPASGFFRDIVTVAREARAALRGAIPEAGSREGLRAALHTAMEEDADQVGWGDSKTTDLSMEEVHRVIDAVMDRAALGDTQEPRPDPLDVERLARVLDKVEKGIATRYPGATETSRRKAADLAREYAAASPAAPDPLRASDLSMAEHSDTRSACPKCGEWRDNPTADCAGCGWEPQP